MKVQEIMTAPALTLDPSTTVSEAAARMFESRVAAMPVVEDDHLVGIVGEADLYRAFAAMNGVPLGGTVPLDEFCRPHVVSDIMRRQVLWVKSTDSAQLAAQLLMRHARSLPVLEHGKVVGMIDRRDVIGPLLADKSPAPVDGVSEQVATSGRHAAGASTWSPRHRHTTDSRPGQRGDLVEAQPAST
jgi:CBS domain-containing protein